jgi:hypothetical protein
MKTEMIAWLSVQNRATQIVGELGPVSFEVFVYKPFEDLHNNEQ